MENNINKRYKSFTSLEQSKKLVEILPIESADMHYSTWTILNNGEFIVAQNQGVTIKNLQKDYGNQIIPCWSLAALLNVLPLHLIVDNQRYEFSMKKGLDKNGETYAIKYTVFNTTFYFHLTDYYNNPVDACYEMILKLHELKML